MSSAVLGAIGTEKFFRLVKECQNPSHIIDGLSSILPGFMCWREERGALCCIICEKDLFHAGPIVGAFFKDAIAVAAVTKESCEVENILNGICRSAATHINEKHQLSKKPGKSR